MNSKQRKTLEAVFRKPTSATIVWSDIESLLTAVGCEVIEGPGSSVSFKYGDELEFFHRPHPAKEAKRYQVRAAQAFLARIGAKP
ncbi:type II toxin-antitoxin system HicA family toxin [Caulobacter segnis]|uniref:type II toxin-antitoxin system HicA family toxin n=1 Tax=Caulobacter segnis TaxID=88688 RepID=UPI00240ED0A0|nr:type II toxin-antitoxin system HicA family toxin [Caulobacter segnis]MDG2522538.1 type II toxin-antitoxin system HicA family toxin [Caulobacter segnis]